MSARRRTRLAKGVYRDRFGVAIVISVNGAPHEFRKDEAGRPYADRPTAWLIRERLRRQARALELEERRADTAETFTADVERFLASLGSPGHRTNSRGYMAHWTRHFADRQRNTLTDLEVQTAFAAMPGASSTKRHLRRALIQFYEALNGPSGYNPGRALKKPPKDEEPVRDLPWDTIERIFAALRPSKCKARLMLIAYVGLPQKLIRDLRPSDLRLDRRELVVRPRRKGAGASGRVVPLSDVAVAALREFQRVNAFGPFQNLQLVRMFWSAATRAGVTLPDDARPYDLRHSFLTEVARGGADIRDIAHLGMHATLEQAGRYIKGAGSDRATKAITAVPRFATTLPRGKTPNASSSLQMHGERSRRPRRRPVGKK